ncbi:DUF3098 domain-containing protein [Alloprevotella sp. OH1205_COT-284]|uniref:DUF3098 domain-containing protein n=1 Tax=Alloprevotella sp. OH1205_COT-284 TaxID=2491043 RepID=UPI000F5E02FF|nr:DUF3098 domain-containing protein [Alloprevotella sp. OH1205_COT-284]RRD80778.1 DUF3098 domain-containing protein [Alloprevotella sp. OH1205_COT-284]
MNKKSVFAFSRINFILLAVSIAVILVGFILMSGKGTTNDSFNPDIFETRRIVVAPVVCLVGYLFMVVAILYRPKRNSENTAE